MARCHAVGPATVVGWALLTCLLASWAAAGHAAAAPRVDSAPATVGVMQPGQVVPSLRHGTRVVKVVVVGQNGTPVSVVDIAARDLDNAQRATEIFRLNQGRRQPDGAIWNSVDEQLHPGWVLVMPDDAKGSDLRQAKLQDSDEGGNGGGNGGATQQGGGSKSNKGGSGSAPKTSGSSSSKRSVAGVLDSARDRLSLPIILAVAGGVLGIAITVALVAHGPVRTMVGRVRRRCGRLVARLRRPGIDRKARRHVTALNSRWCRDESTPLAVFSALVDVQRTGSGPVLTGSVVAARVTESQTQLFGSLNEETVDGWRRLTPGSWAHDGAFAPPARKAAYRPVRLGGTDEEQLFVDIGLNGVLSVDGHLPSAHAVAADVATQVEHRFPDMAVAQLSRPELPRLREHRPGRDDAPRGLAIISTDSADGSQDATGAAEDWSRMLAQLVDDCCTPGCPWTLLVVGPTERARWCVSVDRAGRLLVPMLRFQGMAVQR